MAQLHGRVHRVPDRGLRSALIALALFGALQGRALAQPRPTATAAPTSAPAAPAPRSATTESSAELEATLARLRTDNLSTRRAAVAQLMTLEDDDVPAVRARMLAPLGTGSANVHGALVRAIRAVTGGNENADYDLLDALVRATPRGPDMDVATERVALARAVGRIQSADAGRALAAFALEHDRIFRLESMRIVRNTMHDYVLPALIEWRRPTDEARRFIAAVRADIHRVTPGDTVQTRDNALLAEILRAYGSVRQPDAMNVVVSFVNSDRVQVREAARWAIAQYGREAINVLRTAYENEVGTAPSPVWGWERTARELYGANDRRLSDEVTPALEQGLAAARAGHYDEMTTRFEWVLARDPLFERRREMVAPLVAWAHALESRDAQRAEQVYRTALRVDPTGPGAHAIESSVLYLEAESALGHGVADPELYRAALRADPANDRARAQFEAVAQVEVLRARQRRRVLAAVGLLITALAGLGLIVGRLSPARWARRAPVGTP